MAKNITLICLLLLFIGFLHAQTTTWVVAGDSVSPWMVQDISARGISLTNVGAPSVNTYLPVDLNADSIDDIALFLISPPWLPAGWQMDMQTLNGHYDIYTRAGAQTLEASAFLAGDTIFTDGHSDSGIHLYMTYTNTGTQSTVSLGWPIDTATYCGIRFRDGNQTYFGWLQIKLERLNSSGSEFRGTIVGMAYRVESVGMEEPNQGSGISIYPNPARNALYLKLGDDWGQVNVQVLEVSGRCLIATSCRGLQSEIDVSSLPEGIYLLRVEDRKGMVSTRRFAVE